MHFDFVIDKSVGTAATDGRCIYFAPAFLASLSDEELDIVMMHEVLHVVLNHIHRGRWKQKCRFNIACDIVVNSIIMQERHMTQPIILERHGVARYKTPDGKEGHLYSAEEVYRMLPPACQCTFAICNHDRWGELLLPGEIEGGNGIWEKRIMDAAAAMSAITFGRGKGVGKIPLFAQRLINNIKNPQIDWRAILEGFIQEEIVDYSFFPPDRRFDDGNFYLPDFNEKYEEVKNILFMIDTSGSMSDDEVDAAFSEVHGALEQWGGKLAGYLGFFDAAVIDPVPFESVEELNRIAPKGGGGTDFGVIFDYVRQHMRHNPPASIIILTDGQANFPDAKCAQNIPVLWLLNNEGTTPPWGKIARIRV